MKFVSNKKISDHALRHYQIQQEIAELRAKIRELDAEKSSLEEFLDRRLHSESFQFSDPEGYLMETDFKPCSRQDLDDEKVRAFYAKMGKKVPMKMSEWTVIKTHYVTE